MRLYRRLWIVGLAMTVIVGWSRGSASTEIVQQETPPDVRMAGKLVKPDVLLVYDFAAAPKKFYIDMLGPDIDAAIAELSEPDELGRKAAAAISEQLVERLRSRGIAAKRASDLESFPFNSIVIKGQIMSVDPGAPGRRLQLGLGEGRSEMVAYVQTYQFTRWGLLRIEQAEAIARGTSAPGMAPGASGAAAGSAGTSAVVSGSMNVAAELRDGVEASAGRIADGIAREVVALYERQGWL